MTQHTCMSSSSPINRRGRVGEVGSVTLFLVIAVTGLLVLVGLVVDGGARLRAVAQADSLAAEAARAAGQVIDQPAAITGSRPAVDVEAAAAAARRFLASQHATGTVIVDPAAHTVTVNVTSHTDTVFLALIGISRLSADGHASVTLVRVASGAPA